MATDLCESFWSDRTDHSGSDRSIKAKISDCRSEDTFSWLKDNALSASYQEI
jgi:hypothetical protein